MAKHFPNLMKNNHEENQPRQIIVTQKRERAKTVPTALGPKTITKLRSLNQGIKKVTTSSKDRATNRARPPRKADACPKAPEQQENSDFSITCPRTTGYSRYSHQELTLLYGLR